MIEKVETLVTETLDEVDDDESCIAIRSHFDLCKKHFDAFKSDSS